MKKAIILTIFVSVIFLSGCSNKSSDNDSARKDSESTQKSGNILWKSEAQGDYVRDERDPGSVCKKIQTEQGLNNCNVIISKKSENKVECVDGMSVAGCFACKFECP